MLKSFNFQKEMFLVVKPKSHIKAGALIKEKICMK